MKLSDCFFSREESGNSRLLKRREWNIPRWPDIFRGEEEIPIELPSLKFEYTGIAAFPTFFGSPREPVLFRVCSDMMMRLRCELSCDGRPIDYSKDGMCFIYILGGICASCMTTCLDGGSNWILGAYTHPRWQRKGLMRQIVEFAMTHIDIQGVCSPSESMRAWMKRNSQMKLKFG